MSDRRGGKPRRVKPGHLTAPPHAERRKNIETFGGRRKQPDRRSGSDRRKSTTATQAAGAPEAYKWPQVTMEYCDDESGRYWVSRLAGTWVASDGETREDAFAHLLEAIEDAVLALTTRHGPTLTPEEAPASAVDLDREFTREAPSWSCPATQRAVCAEIVAVAAEAGATMDSEACAAIGRIVAAVLPKALSPEEAEK